MYVFDYVLKFSIYSLPYIIMYFSRFFTFLFWCYFNNCIRSAFHYMVNVIYKSLTPDNLNMKVKLKSNDKIYANKLGKHTSYLLLYLLSKSGSVKQCFNFKINSGKTVSLNFIWCNMLVCWSSHSLLMQQRKTVVPAGMRRLSVKRWNTDTVLFRDGNC